MFHCAFKKNVCSAAFGWRVLHVSIKSIWSNVLFKSTVFIMISYLDYLCTEVGGVLKSPTMIALLSVSHFKSINMDLCI